MEKQIAAIEKSEREVPVHLNERIDRERQQVAVQTRVMGNHIKRQENISKQFNDYIERFKVLKAEQKAKRDKYTSEHAY